MTTFTTKNQSRKRYYRALGAAVVLIILVTFIILSIRDRNVSNSSTNISQRDSRHKYGSTGTEKHRIPFYSEEQVEYEPLIQLPDLQIKGQARNINGKLVASFLSIPYADPPVADNEFESPQAKQFKNISTLNAFYPPIKCYQSSFVLSITEMKALGEESKEDCLYLNIWTPYDDCDDCNKTSTDPKPVMVFIHSGVFQFGGIGTPDLDPSVLVSEKDIIVITIQYRLGIFGFGSSMKQIEDEGFYSLGLQDQAKALEWINQNIPAFGGDPNQITLAGHGAGAMSIGFHLMNPDTNKLFKRAIMQGVQNIWNIGIYGMNDKSVKHIMDDSNCDETYTNDRDVKSCIKQTGVKPIVFLDGQQYLIDTFPVPFVPDYNPLTEEVAKKTESMVPDSKFNISLLETIFNEWNIFSPDHEIMIGLNSDDDYLLEKVNKITTKIHYSEENNEEDYDYENEDENVKSSDNDENENDTETKTEEITPGEEITTSYDHDHENEHEHENEGDDENEENENETTTTEATIDVERRRRRRRRRQTEKQTNLDQDEIVKLCRLVKMYQIQKARTSVTSNVVLYRIDPKVLVNLLEEVIFAFGAKTNWLQDLDKDTINLWGSFVVNGLNGLQETETLAKYESNIGADNVHLNMINIGQMSEDENQSKLSIEMFDWQKQCST